MSTNSNGWIKHLAERGRILRISSPNCWQTLHPDLQRPKRLPRMLQQPHVQPTPKMILPTRWNSTTLHRLRHQPTKSHLARWNWRMLLPPKQRLTKTRRYLTRLMMLRRVQRPKRMSRHIQTKLRWLHQVRRRLPNLPHPIHLKMTRTRLQVPQRPN
jgi:hypothetical protein